MIVYHLVAIPNAQPWNNGRSDTQTECVVQAANEIRARACAALTSGSEGYEAWVVPGFVRIDVIATTTTQEIERSIMNNCG